MSKRSIVNLIVNIVLSIIYLPFTLFSFLFLMGTEATIGETNQLLIVWTFIYSYASFFILANCPAYIAFGYLLYRKKAVVWSYIIRFLPFILFAIAIVIDSIVWAFV